MSDSPKPAATPPYSGDDTDFITQDGKPEDAESALDLSSFGDLVVEQSSDNIFPDMTKSIANNNTAPAIHKFLCPSAKLERL